MNQLPAVTTAGSALLERISSALWVYDLDLGHVVWANAAGLRLWHAKSLTELSARNLKRGMSPGVARRLDQYRSDFVQGDARICERWTLYPGGKPQQVMVRMSGVRLSDDRVALFCESYDVDEQTPDTRRRSDALLHTPLMISLIDAESGDTLYLNPAAHDAYDNRKGNFAKRFERKRDHRGLIASLKKAGEVQQTVQIRTTEGPRWHEISARSCLDPVTGRSAFLISETDVSRLREAEERARQAATTDALTGLPNRMAVAPLLEELIRHAQKRGREIGLLFIDIDQFKTINDLLGHTSGDSLLKDIAERLKALARPEDRIVRLGGDEFLYLAPRRSGMEAEMPALANEILSSLSITLPFGERAITVTSSIGVALYPQHAVTEPTLMQCADLAMYEAKGAGRNALRIFRPQMQSAFEERLTMAADLRQSMEENHFEVYYQPRVSTRDHAIVGAEALLRWNHPRRGMVPPNQFIPLCEETGLIRGLGLFVLTAALRQLHQWQQAGHRMSMSVNVSQRQLADADFAALVEDVLAETEVAGPSLELELTETMILEESPVLQANMNRIRRAGVRLSLDDFGTGYSNLARLRQVEIDCLKIDRSLIKTLPDNAAVTNMVVAIARLMDVKVVAEGVETPEQAAWVRDAHCHEIQGFLFGRPMPAAQFTAVLQRQRDGERSETAA
ncbi:hypothetical protein BJF93_06350 [Xaviernesmea oryzae]|uniref:Uncharacterized protein n=2 Tax=Xaviernesmea oryzae TaxID=464029 RepID=A0A1Q9ASI3_9HYPH|nr:hypothetical protein BJF93_06350 [Xaviernesmea oryzae]